LKLGLREPTHFQHASLKLRQVVVERRNSMVTMIHCDLPTFESGAARTPDLSQIWKDFVTIWWNIFDDGYSQLSKQL
jgi:hypothetical protein